MGLQQQIINVFTLWRLSEVETMNLLQDNGIISDNCISLDDVAETDLNKIIQLFETGQLHKIVKAK